MKVVSLRARFLNRIIVCQARIKIVDVFEFVFLNHFALRADVCVFFLSQMCVSEFVFCNHAVLLQTID